MRQFPFDAEPRHCRQVCEPSSDDVCGEHDDGGAKITTSGEHERRDGEEGVNGKPRIDNKLSERKRSLMEIKSAGKFLQADKTLKAGNSHQHNSQPDPGGGRDRPHCHRRRQTG